jgi:hypothetical protein
MTVVTRATINGGCLQNNDIFDNGKSLTTAKSLHDAMAVPSSFISTMHCRLALTDISIINVPLWRSCAIIEA